MPSEDRGQSEIVGTLLLTAVVILSISLIGVGVLAAQSQEADRMEQPSRFETALEGTSLTVTHYAGSDYALADLVLVIRQADAETRYDGSAWDRSDLDADAVFEGGESVTVSHSYTGDIRILLIDTSAGGAVLYDETKTAPGAEDSAVSPTIEQFDINDTSSGGDASYDVTWNASDDLDDIVEVRVELVNDGTTEDSSVTTFGDVGSTGVNTDTLANASGGGEIYEISITVTDAAGNTASESAFDTADSEIGLRSPVIELFSVTDVSKKEVRYEYEYNASDPDGDLVRVRLDLVRESSGTLVDNVTDNFSEVAATGVRTGALSDSEFGWKDGKQYRIDIQATDLDGGDALASAADIADGSGTSGGTGSRPTIDRFDVVDTSPDGDASFEVTWNASDADGNLQSATLELLEIKNNKNQTVDEIDYSSLSGNTTGIRTGSLTNNKDGNYILRLTVYDDEGRTGIEERTQAADGDSST